MHLRGVEKIAVVAAATAGVFLPPGTISGDARTLLITFLGLISASVLPTISLLINSMSASGRSVQAINKLEAELQAGMDALLFLFGCVALSVGALITLAIPAPALLTGIPYLTSQILPRFGQMIVIAVIGLIVLRAGQLPGILRRSLAVRHEIAVAEAKRKLSENAPDSEAVRKSFASHAEFGKTVTLNETLGKEHH